MLVTLAQCDLDLDVYKKGLITSVPMLGKYLNGNSLKEYTAKALRSLDSGLIFQP